MELMTAISATTSTKRLTVVVPGDYIDEGAGLTAGHGTFEAKDEENDEEETTAKIYASVAGVVHYIDRYVCVKPLRQAFKPDIGDVVVGRIVEVQKKGWSVDIGAYQHAQLGLTNINLPGGEQRRRNEEDQLNMRSFFKEGDLISAEVQMISSQDGKITLQTRNLKYGRLSNGFLVQIDSNFVRRGKVHIHDMKEQLPGVGMILGTNGYVWIHNNSGSLGAGVDIRERMSLLRNAVVCLEKAHIPIFKETILTVLNSAMIKGVKPKDMLSQGEKLTKDARLIIEKEVNLNSSALNMFSFGMGGGAPQLGAGVQQNDFIMNH